MRRFWNALAIALLLVGTNARLAASESRPAPPPSDTAPVTETSVEEPDTENSTAAEEETENSTTEEKETEMAAEEEESEISPEEQARLETLAEADRLYLTGDLAAAERLYREAKAPFTSAEEESAIAPEPIYDAQELSPAGGVYWRNAQAGIEQELESKILVSLDFLVTEVPEFIPGHAIYARQLIDYDRLDDALQILERATSMYPREAELASASIEIYNAHEQWLEASLIARKFALLNPEHPQAEGFLRIADTQFERYQKRLRSTLRSNAIANIITGAIGYAFTGGLLGPLSAVESTTLLLRGESAVGGRISRRLQERAPLLEDEEVLSYVRAIGNQLASYAGRDDFEYEFHVIMDENLNAFALPGGKIYINAGAIIQARSEAELAGLIAHEISHAVLSHGFQLVTEGNVTASAVQMLPYGGLATNLIVLNYSRDMERQADELGTRILAASGYAADGLYNLMTILAEQERSTPPAWLSTHPDTEERIANIEAQIVNNGYDRYTYEGVDRHAEIRQRVSQLMQEYPIELEAETEEEEEGEEEAIEMESWFVPPTPGFF